MGLHSGEVSNPPKALGGTANLENEPEATYNSLRDTALPSTPTSRYQETGHSASLYTRHGSEMGWGLGSCPERLRASMAQDTGQLPYIGILRSTFPYAVRTPYRFPPDFSYKRASLPQCIVLKAQLRLQISPSGYGYGYSSSTDIQTTNT